MKNNILFIGCTQNLGYQFSAANTKVEFMTKGLSLAGDTCTIFNGISGKKGLKKTEIKKTSSDNDIITYPQKASKDISFLFNIKRLFLDLKHKYNKDCKNHIILEFPDYHIYLIYILLARLLGYKISVISHEWGPTVKSTHYLRKPSVWLYSKTFGYFVDGILPISEYIIKKIKHFNKPYLKVPILANFDNAPINKANREQYFLYCVYAAYSRVIFTIIDSFKKYIIEGGDFNLILVLSGSKEQIAIIETYISNDKLLRDRIIIKTKVPYKELIEMYCKSSGLIIPLDPNSEQDEARFSQKIAEYLSSGSPIISNNVGEIRYYFTDRKNIITCDYSTEGFVNAFTWITNNKESASNIGRNGFCLGEKEFNYKVFGKKIKDFLELI